MKIHHYKTNLTWTGNRGEGTADYRSYEREFKIEIEGKPDLYGSSDSAFRGNGQLHNPEDLFLASISSCHMLWYLHLCSEQNIIVLEYRDEATGKMVEKKDGSGRFQSVTLRPQIVIQKLKNSSIAKDLHHKANTMCFIANSCNFPIRHKPRISGIDEGG